MRNDYNVFFLISMLIYCTITIQCPALKCPSIGWWSFTLYTPSPLHTSMCIVRHPGDVEIVVCDDWCLCITFRFNQHDIHEMNRSSSDHDICSNGRAKHYLIFTFTYVVRMFKSVWFYSLTTHIIVDILEFVRICSETLT